MPTVLVVSNFAWYHHLATDLEIALRMRDQGYCVRFVWIKVDNLENVGCDSLSAKRKRRIQKLVLNACSYLKECGVKTAIKKAGKCETLKAMELFQYYELKGLDGIRKFEVSGRNLGIGVISSVISATKETHPGLEEHWPKFRLSFVSAYKVFIVTLELLKRYVPDTVITFNGRFSTARAISEAGKAFGVKVLFHERGANQSKFLLTEFQPHNFEKNREFVKKFWENADPQGRCTIAQNWFDARRKCQKGEFMDFLSENTRIYPRRVWSRKLIVFFASSPDEFESVGDLIEYPIFSNQKEAIDWLVGHFNNTQRTDFVIRVHPHTAKKAETDQKYWRNLEEKTEVVQYDSRINSYDLISKADVVISFGSTIGVEAAYMGKPSVLIGDAIYRGLGCVYEPRSATELAELLKRPFLRPLPVKNCLPFGFFQSEKGELFQYFEPSGFSHGTFDGRDLNAEVRLLAARRLGKRVFRHL